MAAAMQRRALFRFLTVGLASAASLAAPSAQAAGGGKEKKKDTQQGMRVTAAESYVEIGPLSATVQSNFRSVGILVVEPGLDVPDATLRERVRLMLPRLRDAMRTAVAEFTATRYRPATAPDADALQRMMQTGVDRTVGQQGVKVLFASLMVQSGR
jgi:flagellar basal body-associated protein FliL